MKRDLVRHAETPVKVEQIDAAAQQDVLAVVDNLPGASFRSGSGIGRRATARVRLLLHDLDVEAGLAQGRRRREPGHAAT